ncbi:MAG: malto-oligosyltrehalose trehalohydrolase [Thermosynechococcaceae cyanobacterium]
MAIAVGAVALSNNRCAFKVWAPLLNALEIEIWDSADSPESRLIPLKRGSQGYWQITVEQAGQGTLYSYRLNGDATRPDPASQCQPEGVHGRSQVIDHQRYTWQDTAWHNLSLESYICYELHVGTFTPEGTFDAIIPRLGELYDLGINALEIMPVAQFPGDLNWGYDGVYPYAVQLSYGGVEGLKRLVDACHQQGMAVILDVVYNHFGPEGNYTSTFGPYQTDQYRTPWGSAINFDQAHCDGVRQYFIENALYWFRDFHIDALRLDAVHAIYDFGAKHILLELAEAVTALGQQEGKPFYLIAESDLNDGRLLRPQSQGGYDLDAQWSDDFHHCVHALLTGEKQGYYEDFGSVAHLARAFEQSFVYAWDYSPHRQRFHGGDVTDLLGSQFVVCAQNHDQVGNRMLGERLSQLTSFEGLKLSAAAVLLAPAIPMLFMGEEYGEEAPFLYFISHTDPGLAEAVREGRKREFKAFHATGEPPDADSPDTFAQSTLYWEQRHEGHHGSLWNFYRHLIQLRRTLPPLMNFERDALAVHHDPASQWLSIRRWQGNDAVLILMNWSGDAIAIPNIPTGNWHRHTDSADPIWSGPGMTAPEHLAPGNSATIQPFSAVLYVQSAS